MSNRHLGPRHPVAKVAARHCAAHEKAPTSRIGEVACDMCWERAIRDDERVAVLFGVPREIEPDPSYVDVVAVELALQGKAVSLTPAERVEVRERRKVREARRKWQAARKVPWIRLSRLPLSPTDWKGRPTRRAVVSVLDEESAA